MNIYLIDSALKENSGHHDNFARGCYKFFSSSADSLKILSNKAITTSLCSELCATPTFTNSIYELSHLDAFDGALIHYKHAREAFFTDLLEASLVIENSDIIFIPTATPAEVSGLAKWLRHEGKTPRIFLLFHWGRKDLFLPGTLRAALLRNALRDLEEVKPAQLWIGATHKSLKIGLQSLLGYRVNLFPSVTFLPTTSSVFTKKLQSDDLVNVGIVGALRADKGENALLKTVNEILNKNTNVKLTIQTHGAHCDIAALNALDVRRVRLIEKWLPDAELVRLLEGLDIALMPYNRMSYSSMVSGTFTLSAAFGTPCIVPSDTWMAEMVQQHRASGLIYYDDLPNIIADVVNVAINNLLHLKEEAAERSTRWRQDHSAENLIGSLFSNCIV